MASIIFGCVAPGSFVRNMRYVVAFRHITIRASDQFKSDHLEYEREVSNKNEDVNRLVSTYTAPALAAALHDREDTLEVCSRMLKQGNLDELRRILDPYHRKHLASSSTDRKWSSRVPSRFDHLFFKRMRKVLSRLPRHVSKAASKRASVVIPLCEVGGVPSILFTRRSDKVSTHKRQVCFPGGMVDPDDGSIVDTSLREMEEEIGIPVADVDTLGVLRCDWSEIEAITNVAVTPIVGSIGELNDVKLHPNPDEVESCFTVPLTVIADRSNWIEHEFSAPVFTGGPYVVWGLTAYILNRLMEVIQMRNASR